MAGGHGPQEGRALVGRRVAQGAVEGDSDPALDSFGRDRPAIRVAEVRRAHEAPTALTRRARARLTRLFTVPVWQPSTRAASS